MTEDGISSAAGRVAWNGSVDLDRVKRSEPDAVAPHTVESAKRHSAA